MSDVEKEIKLAPCPFCESTPSIMLLPKTGEDPACWIIQCGGGSHDISVYNDIKEKAIKMWNHRPAEKEGVPVDHKSDPKVDVERQKLARALWKADSKENKTNIKFEICGWAYEKKAEAIIAELKGDK